MPQAPGAALRPGDALTALLLADWRVHDVVLAPVTSLEDVPEGVLVGASSRSKSI